jgi:hypothetical protein
MERTNMPQLQAIVLAPAAELRDRGNVGRSRVFIANGRSEEFEEMFAGFITGLGDDCRHRKFR